MIILSLHLVPSNSESPAIPPNFAFGGGTNKKKFGANAPTIYPQTLDQFSAAPMPNAYSYRSATISV